MVNRLSSCLHHTPGLVALRKRYWIFSTGFRTREQTRWFHLSTACLKESKTSETIGSTPPIPPEDDLRDVQDIAPNMECYGTGMEVECLIDSPASNREEVLVTQEEVWTKWTSLALLISPFFFWGTSMALMKVVSPHATPLFVGAFRLLPAGVVIILVALWSGRKNPQSAEAWMAVLLFGIVDGACFQGFLAEGLQRTSAGLGSVIIDSQPITVALLANLFYDEVLTPRILIGIAAGILGLGLLEVPPEFFGTEAAALLSSITRSGDSLVGNIWDSGEWWMLLAAQSMAVGTVMVRWVSKYCDPVMATGWHMVLGSFPLIWICAAREYDTLVPRLDLLNGVDALCLGYITLLGSAASYGVFFYNASKGNLTALSSLTFLTPVFATISGYLILNETLTPLQILGGIVTMLGVFTISSRQDAEQ